MSDTKGRLPLSEQTVYNATSSASKTLLETVFKYPAVCEVLPDGKKGNILSGYTGILLYGAMGLGKSTDIIHLLERVCMYQDPYQGIRQIHIGVLRNSNADFMITLGKSFSFWYQEQESDDFKSGFKIYDKHTRPRVVVRFPSKRAVYTSKGEMAFVDEVVEGKVMQCEVTYFCYSADKKGDEERMKGGEFTITWSNELNTTPQAANDMLTARMDRYPPNGATRSFWIGDLNPKHKGSWEYQQFIENPKRHVKVIQYEAPLRFAPDQDGDYKFKGKIGRWEVNPKALVHRNSYKYWFSLLDKSDNFIENNVLGNYSNVKEGEVMHPDFDPDIHVSSSSIAVLDSWTLLVCIDFGLKCGANLLVQNDQGEVRALASLFSDRGFKALYQQIKAHVMNRHPNHWMQKNMLFIGDPRTGEKRNLLDAATSLQVILEDFPEEHYVVPRRPDGVIVDAIDYRLSTVDHYLKYKNALKIDPDAKLLIDAFSFGYVRDDYGNPDKRSSGLYAEIMDALQYGLTYIALGGEVDAPQQRHSTGKISYAY